MNKLLLTTALVAGVAGATLAPRVASASDGTITINGTLRAQSCQVSGGSSPTNVTVTLPTVSVSSLTTTGSVAGRTPFTISLSNCDGTFNVNTYFEAGPTVMADGNLKNTGVAAGVEVQLLNGADASVINLSAASGSQNATFQFVSKAFGATTATFPYYAQYYATGPASAGAGTVTSTVQFTIVYS